MWESNKKRLTFLPRIGSIKSHSGFQYDFHNGDGAASVLEYARKQYDPDALLNFMARLGWGPKVDDKTTKLLPRERMLELFLTGGKMRSQANMDLAKLDSFDRKYKARKKNATL